LSLARAPGVTEPEDHLGGLFEVMRLLVAGAPGRPPESPARQKAFFESHIAPTAIKFFDALRSEPDSNYYSRVAGLGAAFVEVESQSLQLS
jgi:TorA maturation chaperone TorD